MSISERTAYLVERDYPNCGGFYDFWPPTEEHETQTTEQSEDANMKETNR